MSGLTTDTYSTLSVCRSGFIDLDRPGLETISRLRKVLPAAGIIALTLLEGDAYRQAALAAGADDVVRKAALTTELLLTSRQVAGANRPR